MGYETMRRQLGTHTTALPVATVWARHTLQRAVADAVQQVRRSADGLTPKDHDRLSKFSQGQYLTGVLSFMEIAQKCADISDAAALPEALRGFQVQHHPKASVCLLDAFTAESHANGEFDAAQIAYAADPTEANRLRAIEAGTRQLMETHRSLIALHKQVGR